MRSFANTFSSRFFGRALNPSLARTRAGWPQWNAPITITCYPVDNVCDECASVWHWRREAVVDARNGMSEAARRSDAANARRKKPAGRCDERADAAAPSVGHGFGAFPGFRLALNSLASSGLIILTLAMCGPRDLYGEFSLGEGGKLLGTDGAAVGTTFVATPGVL